MIIIAGSMQFHPDDRDAMLEAFGPLQAATQAEEPGCLAYSFSADPLRPDTVLIFEQWETADALEAHFRHPNFANAGATIGRFRRVSGSIKKYRVDAVAGIVVDGRPSAAFPDA
jgi:quinol monooxygenase YgiN